MALGQCRFFSMSNPKNIDITNMEVEEENMVKSTAVGRKELHPRKFNIAPEKWWLEDYFPIGKVTF